jgi:Ca-activated chloride channel family protein
VLFGAVAACQHAPEATVERPVVDSDRVESSVDNSGYIAERPNSVSEVDDERAEAPVEESPEVAAPPVEPSDEPVSGVHAVGTERELRQQAQPVPTAPAATTAVTGGGLGVGGIAAGEAGGIGTRGASRADDLGAERYLDYGLNPVIDASTDRLVTFAVDVDTASYTNARRALASGQLPQPAGVRVEEFVNFFDYQYSAPELGGDMPFVVHTEAAPSPFAAEHLLLRVGVQAAEASRSERRPANIVFLVDTSGSMQGPDRLGLVQESLDLLAQQLGEDDTISIVAYAGSDTVVLPPTNASNRTEIRDAIASMTAGGGTNGAAGVRTAYELARQAFREGGSNRVVWCSDGDLNIGMTGDTLLNYIEEQRDGGIYLTVLGYGTGNLNDRDLERFANHGDGQYVYVDSRNEAQRVLGEQLVSTLDVVGRDVKLQVELNSDLVARYRLIGYENRDVADVDFRNDAVDAGEVGSGHAVTALIELELREGAPREGELAVTRVRWENPDNLGEVHELATAFDASDVSVTVADASPSFVIATVAATFAEVLRDSEFVDERDLGRAVELLDGVMTREDADLVELRGLMLQAMELRAARQ